MAQLRAGKPPDAGWEPRVPKMALKGDSMSRIGFLVDATNCIGCHTCEVACKDANNYLLGCGFREVASFACGQFPDVSM